MKHLLFVESNLKGLSALKTAKRLGHRVSFIHAPKYKKLFSLDINHPILKEIDGIYEIKDSFSEEELYQKIREIHTEYKIDAGISLVDYCVYPLALACERLGILSTSSKAIKTAKNKNLMRDLLIKENIPTAKHRIISNQEDAFSFADKIGFPFVLKPNSTAGSLYASIIYSRNDIQNFFKEISNKKKINSVNHEDIVSTEIIAEEYLSGKMFSVDLLSGNKQIIPLGLGERVRLAKNEVIELGTTMPANLSKQMSDEIIEYCSRILSILTPLRGAFHIEVIYTKEGPRLIEVNPRLFGGNGPILISKSANIDVFEKLINAHLDEQIGNINAGSGQSVTSKVFGALSTSTIKESCFLEDLPQDLKESVISLSLGVKKGDQVKKIESNFDYIGAFQVMAPTAQESEHLAMNVLNYLETKLGVTLSK